MITTMIDAQLLFTCNILEIIFLLGSFTITFSCLLVLSIA